MTRVTVRDILLVVLLGVLWGVSFMAIKAGLAHFDPIHFAALRYDLAGLIMVLVAVFVAGGFRDGMASLWPSSRNRWNAVLVSAALNVAGYHAFLFWGEQFTSSAIAAVIVGLNPIMATVVARMVLPGERVDAKGLVGLVLGIVGIVVLVGLKPGTLLDARGIGELAVVGCVVSWGVGAVWVKRLGHGMPVIPFTATQMLLGAAILHLLSLALEGPTPRQAFTADALVGLLYLSVIASALGFFIYFTLLERIGPIRSSLVSYIAPIAAAVSGWLVLGESLEARGVVAFLLIVSGFRLVIREQGTGKGGAPGTPAGPRSPATPAEEP